MTLPIACNLNVFDREEHERYANLALRLRSGLVEERELEEGYAFRISTEHLSHAEIAEWIELERKCCPFFRFDLAGEAGKGSVWLEITGPQGVKDFIRDVLSTSLFHGCPADERNAT